MIFGARHVLTLTLALVAVVTFAVLPAIAQSKVPVLPVSMEPNHHVRFDNGKVRIYEVKLTKGQWSQFHEHSADNFYVFINTTSQVFEYADGRHGTKLIKAGEVGFASTANGPYSHRIEADGDVPFHVVDLEILNNSTLGSRLVVTKRAEPHFKLALQNSRGLVYDLVLKPGESTAVFARPANTGIFAVTGGRVSERSDGKAARLWDSEPGDVRWNVSDNSAAFYSAGQCRSTVAAV